MTNIDEDVQRWKETGRDECAVRFICQEAGKFFDELLTRIDQKFDGYETGSRMGYINSVVAKFFNEIED